MKPKLTVTISEVQEKILVEPEPESLRNLKRWFYLNARRDQYYYDKHAEAYVVDSSLLSRLRESFILEQREA
jgi:hypothetical protein